jgi:hypothetical protein
MFIINNKKSETPTICKMKKAIGPINSIIPLFLIFQFIEIKSTSLRLYDGTQVSGVWPFQIFFQQTTHLPTITTNDKTTPPQKPITKNSITQYFLPHPFESKNENCQDNLGDPFTVRENGNSLFNIWTVLINVDGTGFKICLSFNNRCCIYQTERGLIKYGLNHPLTFVYNFERKDLCAVIPNACFPLHPILSQNILCLSKSRSGQMFSLSEINHSYTYHPTIVDVIYTPIILRNNILGGKYSFISVPGRPCINISGSITYFGETQNLALNSTLCPGDKEEEVSLPGAIPLPPYYGLPFFLTLYDTKLNIPLNNILIDSSFHQ